ncbi:MAG TPA: hypothetical protein VF761_04825 [Gemmatimonadaceae bacterium]
MNTAHVHLLLNHIPVLGTLLALALLAWAVARKQPSRAKDGLGLLVILGVVAIVVYLTGGAAEDAVENLPGVSEGLIESHEEAALAATIALGALGLMSLLALWRFRARSLPRWVPMAGLAGAAVVAAMMAWTANIGGQIRHSEIRGGTGGVPTQEASTEREGPGER